MIRTGAAVLLLAFLAAGNADAKAPSRKPLTTAQLRDYPDALGQTADIQYFIVDRNDCDHWRGEEAYDAARGRDIAAAIAKSCAGIDTRAKTLRLRYKTNPVVSALLARYPDIGS
jgi:hypothetical protein